MEKAEKFQTFDQFVNPNEFDSFPSLVIAIAVPGYPHSHELKWKFFTTLYISMQTESYLEAKNYHKSF